VANGNGHGQEELDAQIRELRDLIEHDGEGLEEEVEDEDDDDDAYDEDVNAAERIVEEFGGFDPPLYIQRYERVFAILGDPKHVSVMRKVVDFGCAECKFLGRLKGLPRAREVIGVDIDATLLESFTTMRNCEPVAYEYLSRRPHCPLDLAVMRGSIVDVDPRWRKDVDAVTAIELIEHLNEDVLSGVPCAVFGVIRPKIAVFTTPNSEFNVKFGPSFVGPFRHWDHKFEWTRSEFSRWCDEVVASYPEYSVSYDGVGYDAEDPDECGPCSQIAVFKRSDFKAQVANGETLDPPTSELKLMREYQSTESDPFAADVIHRWTVPQRSPDLRSTEQIVLDEFAYYTHFYASGSDEWDAGEDAKIRLETIVGNGRLRDLGLAAEEIRDVCEEAGWLFELDDDGCVLVVVPFLYPESEYDEDDAEAEGAVIDDVGPVGEAEEEESWD